MLCHNVVSMTIIAIFTIAFSLSVVKYQCLKEHGLVFIIYAP